MKSFALLGIPALALALSVTHNETEEQAALQARTVVFEIWDRGRAASSVIPHMGVLGSTAVKLCYAYAPDILSYDAELIMIASPMQYRPLEISTFENITLVIEDGSKLSLTLHGLLEMIPTKSREYEIYQSFILSRCYCVSCHDRGPPPFLVRYKPTSASLDPSPFADNLIPLILYRKSVPVMEIWHWVRARAILFMGETRDWGYELGPVQRILEWRMVKAVVLDPWAGLELIVFGYMWGALLHRWGLRLQNAVLVFMLIYPVLFPLFG